MDPDAVRKAFVVFDTNNDGSLSRDELINILLRPGEFAWNPVEAGHAANKIISKFDKNGDGRLQYEEFVAWWSQKLAAKPAALARSTTEKTGAAGLLALDEDVIKLIEVRNRPVSNRCVVAPLHVAPFASQLGIIRICLLSWFLSLDDDVPFPRCQDAPKEAFIEPAVAAALMRMGDRRVFVMSYGWFGGLGLEVAHPDPFSTHKRRISAFFRRFPHLVEGAGLFMDYLCLPQLPRTKEEDENFGIGLCAPCLPAMTRPQGLLYIPSLS